ncbi:hypothetical protein Y032_0417g1103 [Ancylostoma ceylanicum]|uniref:Uncharacterized protein n=1 Tax=Ancylostoma ceylanicum TaxID=53326 RepID=A0A016X3C7_9BILA|nr:hypothetical protein Y032_0417g1103 [Ancylostoma ceylanicum]
MSESVHWPIPEHNFTRVLVHFLMEKMLHFQHDFGNALRQLIPTCFPGFQTISATMLPLRWQGCAGELLVPHLL